MIARKTDKGEDLYSNNTQRLLTNTPVAAMMAAGTVRADIGIGTLIENKTLADVGAGHTQRLFSTSGYFSAIKGRSAATFSANDAAELGLDPPVLHTMGQSTLEA